MKRIIFLTAALLGLSTICPAQIRIEKRRYNKGWYIAVPHKHKAFAAGETGKKEEPEIIPGAPLTKNDNKTQLQKTNPVIPAVISPAKNNSFSVKVSPGSRNKKTGCLRKPAAAQKVFPSSIPSEIISSGFNHANADVKKKTQDLGDGSVFMSIMKALLLSCLLLLGLILLFGLLATIMTPLAWVITALVTLAVLIIIPKFY